MEIFLDCLPCILKQALEAARMVTDNTELHKKIMDEAMHILVNYESFKNSPEIAREVHNIVKSNTGTVDPYSQIKKDDIRIALDIYPKLKEFVNEKTDRLYWALKGSATGNMIDAAIQSGIDAEKIINYEMHTQFAINDIVTFEQQLKKAKTLLVVADNAGETVFDRLLLEELQNVDIIYAVRSAPVLNDATLEDAEASLISKNICVMSTGCDAPGLILEECNKCFIDLFYSADIVISKGQGNFETLSDCRRNIYFLLKAKCQLISGLLGVGLNEYVFKYLSAENKNAVE